jgi:hypothetical protein
MQRALASSCRRYVFSDAYTAVTGPGAMWFFVLYYVFAVIVCFNIVTCIVLDVCMEEWQDELEVEEAKDKDGKATKGAAAGVGAGAGGPDGSSSFLSSGGADEPISLQQSNLHLSMLHNDVRGQHVSFNASQITGTDTGLVGAYEANLPSGLASDMTAHLSAGVVGSFLDPHAEADEGENSSSGDEEQVSDSYA